DRAALPVPELMREEFVAPSSAAEEAIVQVVADITGLGRVSIMDNFFALGGDSLSAMKLVRRLADYGMHITPRDVFLSASLRSLSETNFRDREDSIPGVVETVGTRRPLIPIEAQACLDDPTMASQFQCLPLSVPDEATVDDIEEMLAELISRHPAMRSRLVHLGSGGFEIETLETLPWMYKVEKRRCAGSYCSENDVKQAIKAGAGSLDAPAGRLVSSTMLSTSSGDRVLLLILHHITVDFASWRILQADIEEIWASRLSDCRVALNSGNRAAHGTSVSAWARHLITVFESGKLDGDLRKWQAILEHHVAPWVVQGPATDALGSSTVKHEVRTYPGRGEDALTVARLYDSSSENSILLALLMALRALYRDAGSDSQKIVIARESHGRVEDFYGHADLSSTVGWFTAEFPVAFDLSCIPEPRVSFADSALGWYLSYVSRQISDIPHGGVSYGLGKYFGERFQQGISPLSLPIVRVNFSGRMDDYELGGSWRPVSSLVPAVLEAGSGPIDDGIALDIVISIRGDALEVSLSYLPAVFSEGVLDLFSREFEAALGRILEKRVEGASYAVRIDESLVDKLHPSELASVGECHESYMQILPLSPLQKGFAFLSEYLRSEPGEDSYVTQVRADFEGCIDPDRLRRAVRWSLLRHPNLAADFMLFPSGELAQAVSPACKEDWSQYEVSGEFSADAILKDERTAASNFYLSPLRFALLSSPQSARFTIAVTAHHIVIDGWSTPLLLRSILERYCELGEKPDPNLGAGIYSRYLRWLSAKDVGGSLEVWKGAYPLDEPAPLVDPAMTGGVQSELITRTVEISTACVAALEYTARTHAVPISMIYQAAWSCVLSHLLGRSQVAFGLTVATRPPEVLGIEDAIGLFLNTVPVGVFIDPAESITDLALRMSSVQGKLVDHQFVSLVDIQDRIGAAAVFDSLFNFQSFPPSQDDFDVLLRNEGLRLVSASDRDSSHYPLSISIDYSAKVAATFEFKSGLFDEVTAESFAARYVSILGQVAADAS
ncbi:condensation domain-containing protein, partial [Dietzia cercidiphylli]|uniref:condensation domain-containing protein n=1 Tax=Dietzia cercidiphylli TaxID=498199 RepID=UPI003F8148F0